jgi:hypothetical protein
MRSLSAAAVRHYHEHGYYAPVRALSLAEAAEVRHHLKQYETSMAPCRVRCVIRPTLCSPG